jgi:DNA-binding SARP family transcriptional activator
MSARVPSARRLRALLGGILTLLGIVLLATLRPSVPDLPRSISEPLTLTEFEGLTRLLAWLALLALGLLLLRRALGTATRAPSRPSRAASALAARLKSTRPSARRPSSGLLRPPGAWGTEQPVLRLIAAAETVATAPERPASVPTSSGGRSAFAESEPQATAQLAISILGPLRIEDGTRRRRRLRASAKELIAYLALHPHGATRDELLEALWPADDPHRSEQRFWQAGSDARKLLGDTLQRDRDHYRLDRSNIRLDIDELERLLAQADRASDQQAQRDLLERALTLVHGEPLAGCDYPWADGEVRRLRAVLVEMFERVGRARLAGGGARDALEVAERGLAVDGLNEALWRLALEAEGELGLREALEARYGRLQEILDARLGLEPAKETRALYLRLLSQS